MIEERKGVEAKLRNVENTKKRSGTETRAINISFQPL
jgi:hypothetical protein